MMLHGVISKQVLDVATFLTRAGIDHINLCELSDYTERSLLLQKLQGFVDKYETHTDDNATGRCLRRLNPTSDIPRPSVSDV